MKIVELIIDEEQELSGIEAISIVDEPAIEENFIALSKQHEVKLAEVDKEKKILMGAALVPNKNIYRRSGEEEYYIFFSEDTVRQASQLFLMRGNQNKSTLEHQAELYGLSVVESWIIEDEVHDKSRKYGMDLPVGTWMVSMKVNNDDVWNDYVKTGKVKGFSIEGYFADKMERPKESIKEDMSEKQADLLLSQIEKIVKGEKVELALVDDLDAVIKVFTKKLNPTFKEVSIEKSKLRSLGSEAEKLLNKEEQNIAQTLKRIEKSANDLGIKPNSIKEYVNVTLKIKINFFLYIFFDENLIVSKLAIDKNFFLYIFCLR